MEEKIAFTKKIIDIAEKYLPVVMKILNLLVYVSGFVLIFYGTIEAKFEYSFSGFLLMAICELNEIKMECKKNRVINIGEIKNEIHVPIDGFVKIVRDILEEKTNKGEQ